MYSNNKPSRYINTDKDELSNYIRGIDKQREAFKLAKIHGEHDIMADILENIKSEIKSKAEARDRLEYIKRIEKIINWYRTKEKKYLVRTPNGIKIKYPINMPQIINSRLTLCYELLVKEIDKLGFLK